MVVLMDINAKREGDTSRVLDDPRPEESTRNDHFTMLENLPSSIPNSCIYRYEDFICGKLSNGFYGDIFKVQHRETGEMMVLKMNKPDVELDCCTMLDEIKLMSHLSHPNVIRFLGVCIADSRWHLLCEYVNGGDLEELLLDYSTHLEWSTRLYLAKDIAEGMRYLHKQGVIHRDLTSKNCLLKVRNGWRYAIVADLGLATEIKEQSIVGSPYNMAPELLRGEAYDEKADVFSYGIILCEIIGRVPADPDELPRTQKFGVDVEKFQQIAGDCPNEFLQTALCCCQMEPSTRPTFAETSKHLEFTLVGYKVRPEIEEAMDTPSPVTQISQSAEQHSLSPSKENKQENSTENSGAVMNNKSPPPSSPPAIIVSAEASPPLNFRSAEKRRQSWIAGRYKLFNVATDDLLKNTPGKLKSFFHRALRIQMQFDPAKQKKVKRSVSQLKRYSIINSEENGNLSVSGENCDHVVSATSNPNSPNTQTSRFLRRKSSEQGFETNLALEEDAVDGNCSSRHLHSESTFSVPSLAHGQPHSPSMLEVSSSSQSSNECGSPEFRVLDEANRPRCPSTLMYTEMNPESMSRRTASHRECEINSSYSTPEAHIEGKGKLKHRKSLFWRFRRKGSKCKDSE